VATISNGRSRLPSRQGLGRARVEYAVVAAIAAATASMMAVLGMSPEARVPPSVARSAKPALHEPATGRIAPVAVNRGPAGFQGAATSDLTTDAIERAVADVPQQRRDLVLSELLTRLVSQDASAAARVAEAEAAGYLREVALRVVAQSWTRRDAAAALNWASSLVDQDERDAALENAALELAALKPHLALQALDRRSGRRSPDWTLEGVVQQWATNDFASAYAWTEAQPAGPDRDALLMRLVFVRARQDPAEAARIASTAFSADSQRIGALSTIAHLWGAQDPTAVSEFALTLDAKAQHRVRTELALLD
jgi:hypothetical protein